MRGHTPSRRDELESVGYVIIELVLSLMDFLSTNTDNTKKKKRSLEETNTKPVLPWNEAKSDDELLRIKSQKMNMKSKNSIFFQIAANGNNMASSVIKDYFTTVQNLEYAETPNYPKLKKILSRLQVSSKNKIKPNYF